MFNGVQSTIAAAILQTAVALLGQTNEGMLAGKVIQGGGSVNPGQAE